VPSMLRWLMASAWIWIERLGQDLRYAGRMVRRRSGFTGAAILTLTLGIGANTAVFSLLHALLLKSLPVNRPEQLVKLIEQGTDPSSYRDAFTLITHTTLQRESRALSGIIASSSVARPTQIEEGGEKLPVFLQYVSDNYFDGLGVGAFRGRVFHQPPPGSPGEAIAVISEEHWRRHHAGDLSALGARFRLGKHEFTIAGVAPPGFRGTEIDVPTDVWVSFEQVVPPGSADRTRGRWMRVMGRLQPGATLAGAEAESAAILGRPVRLQPGGIGYSSLRRRLSRPLLLLELVVALVLVITCANLANLMLAATASRERELAVRQAVGASRSRVVRQLLTESLVLSAAGGVLSLGVAQWISTALLSFLPPDQSPRSRTFGSGLIRTSLASRCSCRVSRVCRLAWFPHYAPRAGARRLTSIGRGDRAAQSKLAEPRLACQPGGDVHAVAHDSRCVSPHRAESAGTRDRIS
jgi:predicted permease